MLLTSDNFNANVARIGAMTPAQKDRLIARMAMQITQLRQYVWYLYQQAQLTQSAHDRAYAEILRRLAAVENMAGPSGPSTVIHTIQHQWNPPPSQIVPPPMPQTDLEAQVDALLPKPGAPVMVDTPSRPINVVNFDGEAA